jgi:hypothetical protein
MLKKSEIPQNKLLPQRESLLRDTVFKKLFPGNENFMEIV